MSDRTEPAEAPTWDTDEGFVEAERFALVPEAVLYSDLGDGALRLYAVLRRHADADGQCFPGRKRLAELCRCSVDTIDRRLAELTAAGFVVVKHRIPDGRQTSNLYRFAATGPAATVRPPRRNRAAPPAATVRPQEVKPVEREPVKEPLVGLTLVSHDDSSDPVVAVFDAWKQATGRTDRVVLDSKRTTTIKKALKAYPVDDVLDAVRGITASAWHMGENPDGKRYNDLTNALGDSTRIEKFRDLHRNPSKPKKPAHQNLITDRSYTGPVAL